jgi:succinate-semialdehyde dehydrogenase/glutarate-semialdehyde dehydrogenase
MTAPQAAARTRTGGTRPISDDRLLRERCYINGTWVDAADGSSIPVTNPADGTTLGTVPSVSAGDVDRAVSAAAAAFPAWRAMTAKARAVILRRWFDLCMANQAGQAARRIAR